MILDSGPCPAGIESTIIGFEDGAPVLLRPGAVSREAIEDLIGPLREPGVRVAAPGMLKSHYAPRAQLRLNAAAPEAGEPFLAFGPGAPAGHGVLNLSPAGDLAEAAANLFAYLRQLDNLGAASIAVAPIPAAGVGEAINDRLRRAAAPRDAT
jgi:L-threonylcarbamoyladenylate synthase